MQAPPRMRGLARTAIGARIAMGPRIAIGTRIAMGPLIAIGARLAMGARIAPARPKRDDRRNARDQWPRLGHARQARPAAGPPAAAVPYAACGVPVADARREHRRRWACH